MRALMVSFLILAFAGTCFGTSLEQTLTFERSAYRLTLEKGYTRILSREVPVTAEPGKPELPEKPVYVVLPPGTRAVSLRVLDAMEEAIPGTFRVYPRQKDVPGNAPAVWTVSDPAAYSAHQPYPVDLVQLAGQGGFGGERVACLLVHPVRVVPSEGRLTFLSRIRIELELGSDPRPPLLRRREFVEDRERREAVLRGLVVNPAAAGAYGSPEGVTGWNDRGGFVPTDEPSPLGSPVRYVVVTNDAMAPAFQVLADYKTRVGMPAVVRTLSWIKAHYPHGVDDAETIRNFLRDAYVNWGTSNVLLGGDCNVVPIRYVLWTGYGNCNVPGDYYYACLNGTWDENRNGIFGESNGDTVDLSPQLRVGRAPVRNPDEARTLVTKTLRFIDPPDRSYQTSGLLMGQSVFDTGDGGQWCDLMATYFPPEFRKIKLYEHDWGQGNLTKDSVLFYLNQGQGVIYSQTHGQPDQIALQGHHVLYREDLDALTNGDRTPFWYSVNCDGNSVDHDCMGEHAVRSPHGGSVAYYGSTRLMFPYPAGLNMDMTFFDSMFSRGHLEVGQAVNDSKIPYISSAQVDNPYRLLLFTDLLLGDPDLSVWATTPRTLSLDFPGTVPLGTSSFRVRVSSLLGPVSGVRVTVSKAGEVYASGFTDGRGELLLPITPQSSGVLQVAARKDGYLIADGTAIVYPQAPFVTAYRQRVEDDTSAVSSGNGNGVLEAGETIALWLSLKNTGGDVARNVRTTLWAGDSSVAVLDSVVTVPQALAPGDTYVSLVPLRFRLATAMRDGKSLAFTLVTRDSSGEAFSQPLVMDGRAPALSQIGQIVDDDTIPPTQGNGNGVPEPGEVVGLLLRLKNYGGGQVEGLVAHLSSRDSLGVVLDSVARIGRIPAYGEHLTGPNEEVLFKVRKSRDGYRFHLRLQDAYGRRVDRDLVLVPMMPPGALGDDPDSLAITLRWDPLPLPRTYRYNLYRGDRAGGPYVRMNADPLASSLYMDAGLSRGRTYYYVATAVDTSLNESAYSRELAAATFPLYRSGWPRQTPTQVLASPVACDLDPSYPGKELVLTSEDNRIYAWHADGTGLLNPDGLFKTVPGANFFVIAAAAGDLDGDGCPEIVECTFFCDTPRVYVWKGDGSDLPGWPRTLEGNACHNAPVLYDLDGDGWPEVIVATMSGRIYVFRHDGTGYRDPSGLFATVTDSVGVAIVNGIPAVGDVDGDGRPEIVVGGGGGSRNLYAFRWDGTPEPHFPVNLGDVINTSPALGPLDPGSKGLQIVALNKDNQVHVLRGDGRELPGWPQAVMTAGEDASPAIGDVDQDGIPEVIVPGNNQIYVLRTDGTNQPGFPVLWSGTGFSSPVVGDLEGDGRIEVMCGSSDEKFYAWHSDGTKELGFPIRTWGPYLSSATLADMGDRRLTAFVGCNDYFLYGWQAMTQPGAVKLEWWTLHHDEWRTGQYGFIPPRLGVEQGRNPEMSPLLPRETALYQSVPNPMVSGSRIRYDLAQEGDVRLAVYNMAGEKVRTLYEGRKKPGVYTQSWEGRNEKGVRVASGVYFYRLEAGGFVKTRKVVVTR